MLYYAIQCRKCGRYSGKQSKEEEKIWKKGFKCVYCQVSQKLKKKNQIGLTTRIYGPYSAKESSLVIQKLNEKKK